MLSLLLTSSVTTLRRRSPVSPQRRNTNTSIVTSTGTGTSTSVPELALPQLVLALAAATSFHVQIINRVASGYPAWYATVADWVLERGGGGGVRGKWTVRAMVMYALVQGVLFAGFLPPA